MRLKSGKSLSYAPLLIVLWALPVVAQVRVDAGKQTTRIPKACQSVVPASIEGTVDIAALMKEANCKGAGDMMSDYSYMMNIAKREKDKKGNARETSTTYEVFIPILKSGTRARGILVVTSRDDIPVPAKELEKERKKAGEELEKAEEKIAREAPVLPETTAISEKGMTPLGMYSRSAIHKSAFGTPPGGAALDVHTFLDTCDLTFVRRVSNEGRATLVFSFAPRPGAQFGDYEKYIAQLNGEIWIDAQDRIVSRLIAWPVAPKNLDQTSTAEPSRDLPAIYVEMMRLPEGIWLPHVKRVNGVDYPKLFDGIRQDSTTTFSNYFRFTTEIKDVKVGNPPTQ